MSDDPSSRPPLSERSEPVSAESESAAEPVFDEPAGTPGASLASSQPSDEAPGHVAPAEPPRIAATRGLPGPGLPESLLWMVGLVFVQVIGPLLGGIVWLAGTLLFTDRGVANLLDQKWLESQAMPMIALGQAFFLGTTLLASWGRLHPQFARRLPLTPIPVSHFFLLASLVLPLTVLSSAFYFLANIPWGWLVSELPGLKILDEANTAEQLGKLITGAPLPMVLFAVTIVPAIAEELLFRGVLGRGLTARWGLALGVLIASFLFAIAHLHPVHAAGVMPIGIVIHLAYLSTRSFWSPMFLHFANNLLATISALWLTQVDPKSGLAADATEAPPSVLLVALALLTTTTTTALLWKTRVRYLLPDGGEWTPGYVTTDIPPAETQAVRTKGSAGPGWYAAAILSLAAFAIAFVIIAASEAAAP